MTDQTPQTPGARPSGSHPWPSAPSPRPDARGGHPTQVFPGAPQQQDTRPFPTAPASDPGHSSAGTAPAPAWAGQDAAPAGTAHRPADVRRSGPGWGGVIATSAAMALLGSALTFAATSGVDAADLGGESAQITQTEPVVTSTTTQPDWAEVASSVGSSVVAIDVVTGQGGAAGSGVIYDGEGHVVTNNHVVAGADRGAKITVRTSDGQLIPATVLGMDAATDLAVLELDQKPAHARAATFGDSDAVVVGDPVAAIGNPLGLDSTVTTGIVSAVDRPVSASKDGTGPTNAVTNAIQIDASVNPGNSGGPLFDAEGRVIGINSSIATTSASAGSVGLGFAIPADLVQNIVPQLIENGTAEHAYLGVGMRDGTATVDGITRSGAQVMQVEPGTPAAEAGLRQGDVVIAIDGDAVAGAESLTGYVRGRSTGDEAQLAFVRGGRQQTADVTLATRPDGS